MAFYKDYPNRKDWRLKGKWKYKKYHAAASCCNNGGCPYCESNRLHSIKVQGDKANQQLKERRSNDASSISREDSI